MMTLPQLLAYVEQHRVRLWGTGDALRYDAPAGIMRGEPLEALREYKVELLASLRQPEDPSMQRQFPSFLTTLDDQKTRKLEADLLASRVYVRVRCRNFGGEEIILAADGTVLPLDEDGRCEGCVVYRVSEMRHLCQARPSVEALQTIHAIKRELGGQYVGQVSGL